MKRFSFQLILPILLAVVSLLLFSCAKSIPSDAPEQIDEARVFGSVIDGDTIQTYSGRLIRLIGVDAPEQSGPYTTHEEGSNKATSFVRDFLSTSDNVYLEFGPEREDKHGRLLAYVYREGDYRMLNRALVKEGWAEAYRSYSYDRKEEFIELEKEAKENGRGLWEE